MFSGSALSVWIPFTRSAHCKQFCIVVIEVTSAGDRPLSGCGRAEQMADYYGVGS